jgi:hypothetical protein
VKRKLIMQQHSRKKEVTRSELATMLPTMTRTVEKQGCQERRPPPVGDATSERSPVTHKVRPQHTQQARKRQDTDKAMVGTDVLQRAQHASEFPEVLMATYGPYRTARGDRNGK